MDLGLTEEEGQDSPLIIVAVVLGVICLLLVGGIIAKARGRKNGAENRSAAYVSTDSSSTAGSQV